MERRAERRRRMLAAVDSVARRLNNTRSVCRKYYIHPGALEAFQAGRLGEMFRAAPSPVRAGLSPEERALVGFLRRYKRRVGARS